MKLKLLLLNFFTKLFIVCSYGQNKKQANTNKNDQTTITKSGIYYYTPNSKKIDSLKKAMGEDNFYIIADDSNFYMAEISSLLKNKVVHIHNQNINFKNENYLFSKKDSKNAWAIIDYKVGKRPQIYSLVDFYTKLNKSKQQKPLGIDKYLSNNDYFTVTFDINGDGKGDKIISSKRYVGHELLVYFSGNNNYTLQLKSTNFSQDGGNQIHEIKKTNNGFVIITLFPDRGYFESQYFIEYKEKKWVLRNTVHKTKSSNQKNAFIYKCDVKQNLDFSDPNILNKVNSIPDEDKREKVCTKEFMNEENNDVILEAFLSDINNDGIKDKIVVYKNMKHSEAFDQRHFGLPIKIFKGTSNGFELWKKNDDVVFSKIESCSTEGFSKISLKEAYFTIESQICYDYNISVSSYTTFKVSNNEVYLHKYGEEYFDKANHDRKIPTKIWTTKDFGILKFEDLTEKKILEIRQKTPKK